MKNHSYETRRHAVWRFRPSHTVTVSRSALVKAFSTPDRRRQAVLKVVAQYMGNSPVPPSWSLASVRGTFGKKIARLWARHIRGMRTAGYRGANGRWHHPVIQTSHDFNAFERLQKNKNVLAEAEPSKLQSLVMDEAHLI